MKRIFLLVILSLSALALKAQSYPQVVTFESSDEVSATFISVGFSEKAKDVADNAAQSLFYTLFYNGVDGINGGMPLITTDNKEYVNSFLSSRYPFFVRSNVEVTKPEKNSTKMFQGNYRITIVYSNLIKELDRNKLHISREPQMDYSDVEYEEGMVLPTIMVVPYKRDGETYASILADDFDRRIAVGKVQDDIIKLQCERVCVVHFSAENKNENSKDSADNTADL